MGTIDDRVRVRAKRGELKHAVLSIVAATGIISLGIALPNIPKTIPKSLLNRVYYGPRNSRDVAISRLVRDGLLVREIVGGNKVLRITQAGRRYLSHSNRKNLIQSTRKWDKRWRVVMFDIKEPRRAIRDALRRELQAVGFVKIQHSVWAYPYPCEDFIALLKADLHVGKDILYLVVEEMENDYLLKKHFLLLTD